MYVYTYAHVFVCIDYVYPVMPMHTRRFSNGNASMGMLIMSLYVYMHSCFYMCANLCKY